MESLPLPRRGARNQGLKTGVIFRHVSTRDAGLSAIRGRHETMAGGIEIG